jgi:hypothetical protein
VRRLCLGDLIVGFRLSSMYHIRKFHTVLDEEHRNVIANNVPVTFLGVEFDSKTTNIADSVCRATATKDSREPQEDRSLARSVRQNTGRCDIFGRLEEGEFSKGTGATGVDDALRDAFVVEAVDLGKGVS